jgi:hypothetical protein
LFRWPGLRIGRRSKARDQKERGRLLGGTRAPLVDAGELVPDDLEQVAIVTAKRSINGKRGPYRHKQPACTECITSVGE